MCFVVVVSDFLVVFSVLTKRKIYDLKDCWMDEISVFLLFRSFFHAFFCVKNICHFIRE